MSRVANLTQLISQDVEQLPDKYKREVLNFIQYLKVKEDQAFIEYVNDRTRKAVIAKKRGEQFTSLEQLQRSYA